MYPVRKLASIYGVFVLGIFAVSSALILDAFAQPTVQISPTCGPADPGFSMEIKVNGFTPNGTVDYKFVGSDGKIPLYSNFKTNSTGGFNVTTYVEDIKEDHYKMYFADDINNDNTMDIGAPKVYANVTLPCSE